MTKRKPKKKNYNTKIVRKLNHQIERKKTEMQQGNTNNVWRVKTKEQVYPCSVEKKVTCSNVSSTLNHSYPLIILFPSS